MMMTKSMMVLCGLCILFLMPDYSEQHSACRDKVNEYEIGQNWLQNDCKREYFCGADGIEARIGHDCPTNSHCDDSNFYGVCKCDAGFNATKRDFRGFLLECVETCRDKANIYEVGQNWLKNDCTRQYTCTVDGIQGGPSHSCPKNSHCDNSSFFGVCKCDTGFTDNYRDCKGFLQECRQTCEGNVKNQEIGQSWLRNDCKEQYVCTANGIQTKPSYSCPENSTCDTSRYYGVCKCNGRLMASKTDSYGLLQECKAPCYFRDRLNPVGTKARMYHCTYIYTCADSNFIVGTISSCPANSKCSRNVCRCNKGFTEGERDSHGMLWECHAN